MTGRIIAASVIVAVGAGSACSHSHATNSRLLASKANSKYNLTCVFYGQTLKTEAGAAVQGIETIALRDGRTGKEVAFKPADAASLYQSLGYYTDVWSPDGEFLVLPLGRFEGFAVLKSSDAMDLISAGKTTGFVRVQLDSGVRLWHDFKRWTGDAAFEFQAGLSNDFTLFQYSVRNDILTTQAQNIKSMVGVNSRGTLPISQTGQHGGAK
jgi:hypothetical protein